MDMELLELLRLGTGTLRSKWVVMVMIRTTRSCGIWSARP